MQVQDFLGAHIAEFICDEDEEIPNVLTVLFSYFDENPDNFKAVGLFWKSGKEEVEMWLMEELWKGNFDVIHETTESYSVASIIKKIFWNLGEPICTYKFYEEFKSLGDEKTEAETMIKVNKIFSKMKPVNRNTFRQLTIFLKHVTMFEESNKMSAANLAIVFAPNLFKPFELT